MELKHYLRVLLRRWPALVVLPLLAVVLAVVQEAARDPRYSTQARATVIREPETPPAGEFDYDRYYNYLASEFAIDDLVEAVRGNVFAAAVAERLRAEGVEIGAGEVQGAIAADRMHRVLTMNVSSGDAARAEQIARAATAELQASAFEYLGIEGVGSPAVVNIVQEPGAASEDTGRARLLLALQIVAALGAGVLLAFLVDYLDDTLYDGESAAAALALPELASVPAERRR